MVVVVLQLHAKGAARHRVVLVPAHLHELAVVHLVDHGAGGGAVMGTPTEEGFACRLCVHIPSPPQRLAPPASRGRQSHQPKDAPRTCRSARRRRSMTLASSVQASVTRTKGDWTKAPRPFIYLSCGRRPPRSNGQN